MTDSSIFEYRQMSSLLPHPMIFLRFRNSAGLYCSQVSSLSSLLLLVCKFIVVSDLLTRVLPYRTFQYQGRKGGRAARSIQVASPW